jgi:Mlc titration factor MtfA (ptsG expression regulator)
MNIVYVLALSVPAAAVLGLACMALRILHRHFKRRRLLGLGLNAEQAEILRLHVPLYRVLPDELKQQLHGLINVFLSEKRFIGCGGQPITEIIRLTTAGQACMLLLNRKTRFFGHLRTIYVYPDTYVAHCLETDGMLMVEGRSVRLGESWHRGPVVLAWNDVQRGARDMHDGFNVVLHEFAHQLDQENGDVNGTPVLKTEQDYARWQQVFEAEFRRLERFGRRCVLDAYAFEDPAEFFAVATETFFEKPADLSAQAPDVYDQLKKYYKVNPIEWYG